MMVNRANRGAQVGATREALLVTAERLFAERGVHVVSTRQISAAAGQGNNAAVTCDSLIPMLIGRVLQGLSAGVIPLGISIMRDEMPAEKLGSATAMMSASLGIGSALGLPIAAVIADNFDWHILFWGSGIIGAAATALILKLIPESKVRTGGRFDLVGALGLSAALVCLLLGLSKGPDWAGAARPRSASSRPASRASPPGASSRCAPRSR